jgi:hypothetical protein
VRPHLEFRMTEGSFLIFDEFRNCRLHGHGDTECIFA